MNTALQILVVVTLIVVLSQSATIFALMKRDPGGQKAVAEWIRSQGLESPLIMATGPWPAFYAGGRHLYIPNKFRIYIIVITWNI